MKLAREALREIGKRGFGRNARREWQSNGWSGNGQTGRYQGRQAAYSPMVLRIYDWYVLGLSNHLIWRCPTSALRQLYDRNVSARHVDIGVGTGYFLDKARWPVPDPSITLVDLNANSLNAASRRIQRYSPEAIVANALEPLPISKSFKSAGLCYLLHCMPGAIPEKAAVFDHLRLLLEPSCRAAFRAPAPPRR